MRTISLQEIDEKIVKNRKMADAVIRSSSNGRRKKSRTRTPGEVKALNEISIARWQKAVENKKIIRTGSRSMYYDYRE
ncbi:hypothetical protein [Jeotgalibacillus aurantiacus]|uniref:hypothetical protein n=1 Tax=Jeotgalibacillus aurantiacus TaxID=2763266 RepID=UPI001D0BA62D|nr:hypothetical protein [Jeotgalibacillus aurantiacus]